MERFFVCGFEGIYTDGMRETVPIRYRFFMFESFLNLEYSENGGQKGLTPFQPIFSLQILNCQPIIDMLGKRGSKSIRLLPFSFA